MFENVPRVTKNLIIINLIVFVAYVLNKDFMISTFALFYPASKSFRWWQIITHMFMHGGFWHIFFNMYTLFIFGSVIERMIGEKKFLILYLAYDKCPINIYRMNGEMYTYIHFQIYHSSFVLCTGYVYNTT